MNKWKVYWRLLDRAVTQKTWKHGADKLWPDHGSVFFSFFWLVRTVFCGFKWKKLRSNERVFLWLACEHCNYVGLSQNQGKSGSLPQICWMLFRQRGCGCPVTPSAWKRADFSCCRDFPVQNFWANHLLKTTNLKGRICWFFSCPQLMHCWMQSKVLRGVEESFSQLCTDFRGASTRHEDRVKRFFPCWWYWHPLTVSLYLFVLVQCNG